MDEWRATATYPASLYHQAGALYGAPEICRRMMMKIGEFVSH